jgi:hypothetical protein
MQRNLQRILGPNLYFVAFQPGRFFAAIIVARTLPKANQKPIFHKQIAQSQHPFHILGTAFFG